MNLKPKQIQAASLLAQGWLCKDVAEELEITPQTISEWRRSATFEAHLNELKMESLKSGITHLQSLVVTAAETIGELMKSGETDSIRLKAAETVLAHTGISDPSTGLFGWHIGKTTAEEVKNDQEQKTKTEALLSALGESALSGF